MSPLVQCLQAKADDEMPGLCLPNQESDDEEEVELPPLAVHRMRLFAATPDSAEDVESQPDAILTCCSFLRL